LDGDLRNSIGVFKFRNTPIELRKSPSKGVV